MTRNEQAVKIASGIAQANSSNGNFLLSDITQLTQKIVQRGRK